MLTAWTPTTRASSLLPPDSPVGPRRVYFYDLATRLAIQNTLYHQLDGMFWTGTGSMVSYQGRYVDGTTVALYGAFRDPTGKLRRVKLDRASFPGRMVVAKIWYARIGDLPDWWAVPEWRVLARGDGSPVLGRGLPIENRAWTAAYLAGLVS